MCLVRNSNYIRPRTRIQHARDHPPNNIRPNHKIRQIPSLPLPNIRHQQRGNTVRRLRTCNTGILHANHEGVFVLEQRGVGAGGQGIRNEKVVADDVEGLNGWEGCRCGVAGVEFGDVDEFGGGCATGLVCPTRGVAGVVLGP